MFDFDSRLQLKCQRVCATPLPISHFPLPSSLPPTLHRLVRVAAGVVGSLGSVVSDRALRAGSYHSISSFGFVLLIQDKLEHILRGCHKNVIGCVREALIRLQNLAPHS